MESRRDYAVRLGLAKPGRGRMSTEAHSAITKALAEGMRFSDVKVNSDSSKPVTSQEATKDSVQTFTGPTPDALFNGGWFYWEGKKKVNLSGAEVCRRCMVSLDWHRCSMPMFPSLSTNEMVPVSR